MPGELLTEKPASAADSEASGGEEQAADGAEQKTTKPEAPASKAVVGIIYPPPEVRNIVDKTADFVARNGPEFEERIRLNEAGNPKFNFLALHDPYHAYYEHKIKEIREGVAQEAAAAPPPLMQQTPAKALGMVAELEVPTVPPPEWEFSAEPPSISALELDIVKLTAQFVARNGAMFLDKLMMREQRNYQFDFLRKQHPLFSYFTKLVEQYSRVLLPPKDLKNRLTDDVERPAAILERSQHRFEWEQFQLKQRRRVEAEEEKERVEYAQIDWHSFVIVETINFRESEAGYLPPPIHSSQLAQRLLQQQKYERLDEGGEVEEIEMELEENEPETTTENKDMEVTPSSPPPAAQRAPALPPAPPTAQGQTLIRHGYNPKAPHGQPSSQPGQQPQPQQQQQPQGGQAPSGNYLISPITGEKIPAEKMQEHMRYGLLDPRWREEQKKQVEEKKTQEEVFAEGMQIGTHLKYLAERRTDIFGMEETLIGRKIGEEEKKRKNIPGVQWDGHSGSADTVVRQAQSNITEQLSVIQRAREQAEKEQLGPKMVPPRPLAPPQPKPPLLPPSSSSPMPLFPGTPIMNRPPGQQPQPHMMPPQPRMPQSALLRLPNSAPPVPGMLGGGPPPPHLAPPPQQPGMFQPHPPPMHLPPGAPPPMLGGMPPFPPDMGPPAAKRLHTETDGLMPEQEFINKNPGPVTFKVQTPSIPDRPEWKLSGQIISITLPITDPVSVIKAKISDDLCMPSGKQKLQIGSIFIKDSNSLGFYNFTNQTVVSLGLKERGGRRK